jgi:1,4-alpha-glucan branching enzyme
LLVRDHYDRVDLETAEGCGLHDPLYRDYHADAGFELPSDAVRPFLGEAGNRTRTGYTYRAQGGGEKQRYDPQKALEQVRRHARAFLDARIARLHRAGALLDQQAISLCVYNADTFGRFWYEGPRFIEALFREGAARQDIQFMNPGEYLFKQDRTSMQTMSPEFSSWGFNGYGEMWLDASNDWMYPHSIQALKRMIELAERFPNDSGLKERALNQAAREILLLQAADWPRMLYKQESVEYARHQIEEALGNFTTIYESLGSNYLSTEWLTNLERRHNVFPRINYRIFRRKR